MLLVRLLILKPNRFQAFRLASGPGPAGTKQANSTWYQIGGPSGDPANSFHKWLLQNMVQYSGEIGEAPRHEH